VTDVAWPYVLTGCVRAPERYVPQPLVVQGPGAGAAVTAAGIYADFIRIVDQCPE